MGLRQPSCSHTRSEMLSAASWTQRQGHWQPVILSLPVLGLSSKEVVFMPWEWVMAERLLYAQAWPNVSLGKGCPSALHLPSGWISWDRSDVPGERICASLWFKFFPRREWWLEKAIGRRKDFLPVRCSTGTGQGLAAASAPSSP